MSRRLEVIIVALGAAAVGAAITFLVTNKAVGVALVGEATQGCEGPLSSLA